MLERLRQYLQKLAPEGIALAYSGGVDSTLLLAVLAEMAKEKPFPLAVLTAATPLQDKAEIKAAADIAAGFGVERKLFSFDPFLLPEVAGNLPDRCYHCKRKIFSLFAEYAAKHGLQHLVDGTNADDLRVYRPGRKALRELGVVSPLSELEIAKADVRRLSAALGLPTANKPAVPCLATRFDYNTRITAAMVEQVAEGERVLRRLFPEVRNLRLRVRGNLARIEADKEILPLFVACADAAVDALKTLGFDFVTLDLEGFRSGSQDVRLPPAEKTDNNL